MLARRGAVEIEQVFEDGARGRRFLDLSPFLRAGASAGERSRSRPTASGRGSGRPPVPFRNPASSALATLRVLVVAPHPDDAEIAAFGVYSSPTPTSSP